jgi:hypothetical protein
MILHLLLQILAIQGTTLEEFLFQNLFVLLSNIELKEGNQSVSNSYYSLQL